MRHYLNSNNNGFAVMLTEPCCSYRPCGHKAYSIFSRTSAGEVSLPCPTAASLSPNHWACRARTQACTPTRARGMYLDGSMYGSVFSPLMKSDRPLLLQMEAILLPAEWWWGGEEVGVVFFAGDFLGPLTVRLCLPPGSWHQQLVRKHGYCMRAQSVIRI